MKVDLLGIVKVGGHDGVTSACIKEGLASEMVKTRKMAQFAKNARSFEHKGK